MERLTVTFNSLKDKVKSINYKKIKRILLGMTFGEGIIYKIFIYSLLIGIGFVFIFPLLYMLSYSLKDLSDLLNPLVDWIPTKLYLDNFDKAIKTLRYFNTFISSLRVTLIPAILQTISCALAGYGFARFKFPFKRLLMALAIVTFIIPPQVTMIPKYVLFYRYHILRTHWSINLPAILGQGINSAIFILIFYQFFRMVPVSLHEAAEIDGANKYYIFFKIAVPLSIPAFITSFLFSFVWYWNETYISALFLEGRIDTLQITLFRFVAAFQEQFPGEAIMLNEGIRMAATLLIIIPVILVYFALQHWFIEGIDRVGITGE